jgi:hypothetical protein
MESLMRVTTPQFNTLLKQLNNAAEEHDDNLLQWLRDDEYDAIGIIDTIGFHLIAAPETHEKHRFTSCPWEPKKSSSGYIYASYNTETGVYVRFGLQGISVSGTITRILGHPTNLMVESITQDRLLGAISSVTSELFPRATAWGRIKARHWRMTRLDLARNFTINKYPSDLVTRIHQYLRWKRSRFPSRIFKNKRKTNRSVLIGKHQRWQFNYYNKTTHLLRKKRKAPILPSPGIWRAEFRAHGAWVLRPLGLRMPWGRDVRVGLEPVVSFRLDYIHLHAEHIAALTDLVEKDSSCVKVAAIARRDLIDRCYPGLLQWWISASTVC